MNGSHRNTIIIELPVPPTDNQGKAPINGRLVKTELHREYCRTVQLICLKEKIRTPLKGDVQMTIRWYRAQKKGDVLNRTKTLCDALQGFAYENDSQIADCRTVRSDEDPKNPRIVVTIDPIEVGKPAILAHTLLQGLA